MDPKVMADTMWTLITAMLVFFMNCGFACVEAGFQQSKNCVNVLSKNFVVFACSTISFWFLGWGLMFGVIAIVGMPPFGVFTSEFLILTATMKGAPYLAPVFLLGLAVAFAALFRKVMPMVFGRAAEGSAPLKPAHIPVLVHIILVLAIGLYLPVFLSDWFHTAVKLLR